MEPSIVHTRKITFEVYNEHPKVGDYCTFANATVEKTGKEDLDFAYVSEIRNINGEDFVVSRDLYAPVKVIYCWKLKMSVHD